MDILHLIDRLEELFNESKPIWFTHSVILDEDKMLDMIDQMRVSIPEEIKKAQQLLAQRDRILAQAQEEANRTLTLAREKSEQIIERDPIVQSAQARAEQIINSAKAECDIVKQDADQYALDTLLRLKDELDKSLIQVRNGIGALKKETPPIIDEE
jgi:cell division septum initiation protein DivIVA